MAKKFNPQKYGKVWSTIDCELMKGAKAKHPQGDANQPIIGTLFIDGKRVELTFSETNQLELVKQAGLRQQYIDQSVSLNLAFPSEATPKWLNKVHFDAWKNGVKTLYYMRTESVLRGDIAQKAMSEDCLACDG